MSRSIVLFATDFSNESELALTHAHIFARATDARMLLVHVTECPDGKEGCDAEDAADQQESLSEARNRLEMIAKSISDVSCDCRVVCGEPAREVLRLANEEDVSLVVMGTHGRTGLKRILMGSVAEEIVREATCPVLTVKMPPDA